MLDPSSQRQLEVTKVLERELVIPRRIERRYETHDLLDFHPAIHCLVFSEVTDAAAKLDRLALRIEAEHADCTVIALEETKKHSDRCRLSRRVPTQKGECT